MLSINTDVLNVYKSEEKKKQAKPPPPYYIPANLQARFLVLDGRGSELVPRVDLVLRVEVSNRNAWGIDCSYII